MPKAPAYVPVLTETRLDRDGAAAKKREGDEAPARRRRRRPGVRRVARAGRRERQDAGEQSRRAAAKEQYEIFEKSSTKGPGGGLARGARRASAGPGVRQGVVPRGTRVDRAGRLRERGAGVFRGDADRRGQRRAEAGVRRGDPPRKKREQAREVTHRTRVGSVDYVAYRRLKSRAPGVFTRQTDETRETVVMSRRAFSRVAPIIHVTRANTQVLLHFP